ncbi:MAG: hypothetical protein R3B83_03815 [Nitrospirales bacterium]|nr:hypothetical protein [Nitrospirales bacterium]
MISCTINASPSPSSTAMSTKRIHCLCQIHANAVRDVHGQVEYLMVSIQDLTKQKRPKLPPGVAERLALAAMNVYRLISACWMNRNHPDGQRQLVRLRPRQWRGSAAPKAGANYFSFVPRMAGGQILIRHNALQHAGSS